MPKDTWFRAYLKGNLLMPQTYDGAAVFLAQAALEEGGGDALETATCLSSHQLASMRRSMQSAHRVRRVPAGDRAFVDRAREDGRCDMSRAIVIDDERLRYIWNRFRERAVLVVQALTLRPDGLAVADQLVAGFQTRECSDLLRQYRAQYDRRRDGSDRKAAALRRDILHRVDAQVRAGGGAILQELFGS